MMGKGTMWKGMMEKGKGTMWNADSHRCHSEARPRWTFLRRGSAGPRNLLADATGLERGSDTITRPPSSPFLAVSA